MALVIGDDLNSSTSVNTVHVSQPGLLPLKGARDCHSVTVTLLP